MVTYIWRAPCPVGDGADDQNIEEEVLIPGLDAEIGDPLATFSIDYLAFNTKYFLNHDSLRLDGMLLRVRPQYEL